MATFNINILEPTESFWTMYFKSCALSNEVYGIYLSKLRDGHPKETGDDSDCEEIVEAMANVSEMQLNIHSAWKSL